MLYTEKRGKYHLPNIHVICGDNESVVQSGPCGTIKNRQKESLNKKNVDTYNYYSSPDFLLENVE